MSYRNLKRCVHCEEWNELDAEECHVCDSTEFSNPELIDLDENGWQNDPDEKHGWVDNEDDDEEGFDSEYDWEWMD